MQGEEREGKHLVSRVRYLLKLVVDLEVITLGRNIPYYLHPCTHMHYCYTIVYTERTLLQKTASGKSLLAQSTKQGMQMSESQI